MFDASCTGPAPFDSLFPQPLPANMARNRTRVLCIPQRRLAQSRRNAISVGVAGGQPRTCGKPARDHDGSPAGSSLGRSFCVPKNGRVSVARLPAPRFRTALGEPRPHKVPVRAFVYSPETAYTLTLYAEAPTRTRRVRPRSYGANRLTLESSGVTPNSNHLRLMKNRHQKSPSAVGSHGRRNAHTVAAAHLGSPEIPNRCRTADAVLLDYCRCLAAPRRWFGTHRHSSRRRRR